jgi:phage baseplate assembly protein W
MTTLPSWRGVRFLIPGFDLPESPFAAASGVGTDLMGGLSLTPRGGLDTVSDRAAVRQALLLLLLTRPGERVLRPTYGCELFKLIFWPNDDTTAGLAIHYVRQAIARWEPRVDRVRVDAQRNPEQDSRLDITLEYRVRSTGDEDRLSVQLDLEGGGR